MNTPTDTKYGNTGNQICKSQESRQKANFCVRASPRFLIDRGQLNHYNMTFNYANCSAPYTKPVMETHIKPSYPGSQPSV